MLDAIPQRNVIPIGGNATASWRSSHGRGRAASLQSLDPNAEVRVRIPAGVELHGTAVAAEHSDAFN
jgi:hypothetical protein